MLKSELAAAFMGFLALTLINLVAMNSPMKNFAIILVVGSRVGMTV
jgi:hypothetical protein